MVAARYRFTVTTDSFSIRLIRFLSYVNRRWCLDSSHPSLGVYVRLLESTQRQRVRVRRGERGPTLATTALGV
jgi:hypothetical protein